MVNFDHLPAASRYFDGKLYQNINDDLQLAGMSKRTAGGYLRAVRQLADYCKKCPNQIIEAQLRRYFLCLKNEKQFACRSLNETNRRTGRLVENPGRGSTMGSNADHRPIAAAIISPVVFGQESKTHNNPLTAIAKSF